MKRNKAAKIAAFVGLVWACIGLFAINIAPIREVKWIPPPPRPVPPRSTVQFAQVLVNVNPEPTSVAKPVDVLLDVKIEPNTPLVDLLPPSPKIVSPSDNRLVDDPRLAPEVTLQDPLSSQLTSGEAIREIATQLAKIRQANMTKTDGFLQTLIEHRDDMRGMPFAMGERCRTPGARAVQLASLSSIIRTGFGNATIGNEPFNAEWFWAGFAQGTKFPRTLQGKKVESNEETRLQQKRDDFDAACIAMLTQVLSPEAAVRLGLVQYLSKASHIDATKALAKMALFSEEKEVRAAAIRSLKVRRERDYLPILMEGFHYPLPRVAQCAAEAIVGLDCREQAPQIVNLLEDPDPRLPVTSETNGTTVVRVREVVRINHHRSCILCHAPADVDAGNAASASSTPPRNSAPSLTSSLTAQIPLPNEPLRSLSNASYGSNRPTAIMVRFDVTYLRQDFSLYMPVENAAPWPYTQRFDFLVRTRVLSEKEVEEYRQNAPKPAAGATTPYQRAILFALRGLTQRDTAPTPEAWRELLALPAKKG